MISGAYPATASGFSPVVTPGRNPVPSEGSAPSEAIIGSQENSARVEREKPASSSAAAANNGQVLDEAQLKELSELKARDREVRAHEAAHQAVGGQYAGAISYVFQRGPDGAQYAVGGEVSIDVGPVQGDPQATIEKMRVVRAAAMAPAEPSAQDRAVAAQAMQTMLQAQAELSRELSVEGSVESSVESGADRPTLFRQASEAYEAVSRISEPDSRRATSISA